MAQKRITIKKGAAGSDVERAGMPGATGPAPIAGATAPRKPRRRTAGVSPAPFIIIVLIIVGVAAGGFVTSRNRKMEVRRAILHIEKLRKEAMVVHEETVATCKKVKALTEGVEGLDRKVVNAVKLVLGEDLDDPGRPPQAIPETSAALGGGDAPNPAASGDGQSEREERVAGIMTREELDARRARERKAARAKGGDTNNPETGNQAHAGGALSPPIKAEAREARAQIELLRSCAQQAGTVATVSAEEIENLKRELRLDLAARKRAQISELRDTSSELLTQATEARANAERLVERVEKMRNTFELAEQERRKEEDAERKKRAHEELVARERAAVVETESSVRELWETFSYEAAHEETAALLAATTTYEAQGPAQLLADKAEALANMKAYLIEQLNKDPLQWGWKQSGGARHITGADKDQVLFTGGSAPWVDVTSPQMTVIIKQYLASPKTLPSLQVEHAAALGLYYNAIGQPSEAMRYVERGCGLRPESASAIRRLVPLP